MFILTEKNQAEAVRQTLRQRLEGTGVTVAHPGGEVLVLEGETFRLDGESLRLLPGVRAVQRLTEPYPLAARTGASGGHGGIRGQGTHREGLLPHCRALRRGVAGAGDLHRPAGVRRRGAAAARRRLQAPDLPLYLWRAGGRGAGAAVPCGPGDGDAGGCRRSPIPDSCRCFGRWTSCRWAHGICRTSSCCGSWGGRRSRCC